MEERLKALDRMRPRERIAAIEDDLRHYPKKCTDKPVFHRKTLVRMLDAARLEAGLVTPEQSQRENSPVERLDFTKATIVFRRRVAAESGAEAAAWLQRIDAARARHAGWSPRG